MKKLFCMIALAAISFGTVFASTPIKASNADTTVKIKKKMNGNTKKMKMKKKMKTDTTKM